jgi:ribosomal protein S18 acetylase RimI-like enzyme
VSVVLLKATLGHVRGIARVYVDAWRATYAGLLPPKTLVGMDYDRQSVEWSHQIKNKMLHAPILVAFDSDAGVIGVTGFGRSRIEDRPSRPPFMQTGVTLGSGEVFTLYVHPDHQNRGVGRTLLAGAFEGLRERGLDQAYVWVLHDNPARYFYERAGGKLVASRRERMWGVDVAQVAYGWPDLGRALNAPGLAAARRTG